MPAANDDDEFWFSVAEQQERTTEAQNIAANFTIESKKKFDKEAVKEAEGMMWFGGNIKEQTEPVRILHQFIHS